MMWFWGLLKEFFNKSRDIEIFYGNKRNCKTLYCKSVVMYGLDVTSKRWHQCIESRVSDISVNILMYLLREKQFPEYIYFIGPRFWMKESEFK